MKGILLIGLCLLVAVICMRMHPKCDVTFRVIDDERKPVANAKVAVRTFREWKRGPSFGTSLYDEYSAVTDKEGLAKLTFASRRGEFEYSASAGDAFYGTWGMSHKYLYSESGAWMPKSPELVVQLRAKVAPIPLYVRLVGTYGDPMVLAAYNEVCGFDLEASDWVYPLGKGETPDLLFKLTGYGKSLAEPHDITLEVAFSNKGDGIQMVTVDPRVGSGLRLPRNAPIDGYTERLSFHKRRTADATGDIDDVRDDQNFYFRVRTRLDEDGKVQSALYGKIYGPIRFGASKELQFQYYLNGNPNDTNLEWRVGQNLLKGVPNWQVIELP